MWATVGLCALGLAAEVVHFVLNHAIAVSLSSLGGVAFIGGMIWRRRAKITVASAVLYGFMAFRLFDNISR